MLRTDLDRAANLVRRAAPAQVTIAGGVTRADEIAALGGDISQFVHPAEASHGDMGMITREDLVAFHRAWFHPGNFILSVSGDFEFEEMLARLEEAFTGWPGEAPEVPPVPAPTSRSPTRGAR